MARLTVEFYHVGGINGFYQIIGSLLKPIRDKAVSLFRLNRESFSHKLFKTAATFILIDLSWVFFRANGVNDAMAIMKSMLTAKNIWILFDDSLFTLGLDWRNFLIMLFSITVLLIADCMKKRGICIREAICRQELWFRWIVLIAGILFVLIFGIWGSGYDAVTFLYFQF